MNRKCDGPLSNFACNCNLRHYTQVKLDFYCHLPYDLAKKEGAMVGLCRLTPG